MADATVFGFFICRHCDRAVLLLARQLFETLPITRWRNFEDTARGATLQYSGILIDASQNNGSRASNSRAMCRFVESGSGAWQAVSTKIAQGYRGRRACLVG